MGKVQTNGMTLAFTTSSWDPATIISYSKDGATADDVDNSDLSTTTARTFEPGVLIDEGTYTFDLHFDTTDTESLVGVADVATIQFPIGSPGNTTNATEVFSCYINNSSRTGGINELINGSITLKVNGSVTPTPESA